LTRRLLLCLCILLLAVDCKSKSPVITSVPTSIPVSTLLPSLTPQPTVVGDPDVVVDCAARLIEGPLPYGTNGWWTDEDADMWRVRYGDLQPQIVRLLLAQTMLEPVNDDDDPTHINWTGFNFDRAVPLPVGERTLTYRLWFETLRDLDITVMLYIPYLAGWLSANGDDGLYSTYPPRSVAEYREFVEATLLFLVDEVGYPPERIILEPLNEPDLRCGQDVAVPCFWRDWTIDDLVAAVLAAREAADAVAPTIRVVGLSICCDDTLVSRLMREYDGIKLLDGLTYHRYERGFDQHWAVEVGQRLAEWDLPVYINEYGSPKYWSDGDEGALWHAVTLAQLWPAGIAPIQFPMSEFPGMHAGYNQLGLFRDWHYDWEVKPAYMIYVGFFRHMGPITPVSTVAQEPLVVAAGWDEEGSATVWTVNAGQDSQPDVVFRVENFGNAPADVAVVTVCDILAGGSPVDAFTVVGAPLTFAYDLPGRSVYAFVLTVAH
jgi:hypothetical protein